MALPDDPVTEARPATPRLRPRNASSADPDTTSATATGGRARRGKP